MSGIRKCLKDEFSSLYILNLKGGVRGKLGTIARREGGNVFDIMTGVAISVLVKNPQSKTFGEIHYFNIGDFLTKKEKLEKITELKSIFNIDSWDMIHPDKYHDWISQRDEKFDNFIPVGDKKNLDIQPIFSDFSTGVITNRDSWAYNYSKQRLSQNMNNCIKTYNHELKRYKNDGEDVAVEKFINLDKTKIDWSRALRNNLKKGNKAHFHDKQIRLGLYRPFTKINLYFDRMFNEGQSKLPKIYPQEIYENQLICVTGIGSRKEFSIIITNIIPDLQIQENGQCFPLYLYEEKEAESFTGDLFAERNPSKQYERKDAISDKALAHFADYYNQTISKEDLFYYIYGLLHSIEYREKYADNLSKQLPRIPRVKSFEDFMAFSKAGLELADLHLNYETVDMYMGVNFDTALTNLSLATPQQWAKSNLQDSDFYVEKMKFAKKDDKSKIVYNGKITLTNIPLEAYDYVVNGKSAIEWVMERQSVKTDKDSGITNNANDWAIETMHNARYPLELLLRVINVSLKTNKIVAGLPILVLE